MEDSDILKVMLMLDTDIKVYVSFEEYMEVMFACYNLIKSTGGEAEHPHNPDGFYWCVT